MAGDIDRLNFFKHWIILDSHYFPLSKNDRIRYFDIKYPCINDVMAKIATIEINASR